MARLFWGWCHGLGLLLLLRIGSTDEVYLAEPSGRRNHGCAVVNNELHSILGRWAESSESVSLDNMTAGPELQSCSSNDDLLCNLNHVVAVPVQKLEEPAKMEIWLPCGFENHRVGHENSTEHVRILDPETLEIRYGPKIAIAGGACAAVLLPNKDEEENPYICAIGGTDGNHNTGTFLSSMRCYDRRASKWIEPFDSMPLAVDHANAVFVNGGTCASLDTDVVLVANFRISHYANMRTEVFALNTSSGSWSLFSNDTGSLPRDAAGALLSPDGRFLLQFGGVYYIETPNRELQEIVIEQLKPALEQIGARIGNANYRRNTDTYRTRVDFDEIRALDICGSRKWLHLGRMPHPRFAVQSCADKKYVFTCGGTTGGKPHSLQLQKSLVSKWNAHKVDNKTQYLHQNQSHHQHKKRTKHDVFNSWSKRMWLGGDQQNFADCDVYTLDNIMQRANTAAHLLSKNVYQRLSSLYHNMTQIPTLSIANASSLFKPAKHLNARLNNTLHHRKRFSNRSPRRPSSHNYAHKQLSRWPRPLVTHQTRQQARLVHLADDRRRRLFPSDSIEELFHLKNQLESIRAAHNTVLISVP